MTFEDWLREQLPRMVRFADALCGRSVSEEINQILSSYHIPLLDEKGEILSARN